MKLLYVKLSNGYYDDFTYQENILPAKYVHLGYDTYLFVSPRSTDGKGNRIERKHQEYTSKKGVHIRVLPFSKKWPWISRKMDMYDNLVSQIEEIQPDVIYTHSLQFLSIMDLAKYKRRHPEVIWYVDNHADYIIMPVNTWRRKIIQKVIYRFIAWRIYHEVNMFYGVSPSRAVYLHEVYHIPEDKISVIKQGGDEDIVNQLDRQEERQKLQEKYGIPRQNILIVSGAGNMDEKKKMHLLLEAVANRKGISILLFGTFNEEERVMCKPWLNAENVHYIGRIVGVEVYRYFVAADLAIFPGQHSILWDQAVASGTPVILRHWDGMDYFNVNGNCIYLKEDIVTEISNLLTNMQIDPEKLEKLTTAARGEAKKEFSYIVIAKKTLGLPG